MSRIMCLEKCPYKSKTGYCRSSYCDDKPFFLYKDGYYAMIRSSKSVIDKQKILDYTQDEELKQKIQDGYFDVDIAEKENRYEKDVIDIRLVAKNLAEYFRSYGFSMCGDMHEQSWENTLREWKDGRDDKY